MAPEINRLSRELERLDGIRLLVIGDGMLDHYIWGETSRISPEAPVPVVKVKRESGRLGGAANVAYNVKTLGGTPLLVAVVGEDEGGRILRAKLAEHEISAEYLVTDPDRPTIKKTRVIARSQQVVRIDREQPHELDGALLDACSARIAAALPHVAGVLISDYGKGIISRGLLEHWLLRFREAQLPVCVDPKETHFHNYRGVTILTPNQKEASFAAGRPVRDAGTLDSIGRQLLASLEAENLLITRGEEGMSLYRAQGDPLHIPAVGREVYDVTGAGDTVISTLALGLAAGLAVEDATRLANHAAGRVIRELGTAAATRAEILQSLQSHPRPGED